MLLLLDKCLKTMQTLFWNYQRSVTALSMAPAAQVHIMDCLIRSPSVCGFPAKACCWPEKRIGICEKEGDFEDAPTNKCPPCKSGNCQASWISSKLDRMINEYLCYALGGPTSLNHKT